MKTTILQQQEKLNQALEVAGLRNKVMVMVQGVLVIKKAYIKKIGANGNADCAISTINRLTAWQMLQNKF